MAAKSKPKTKKPRIQPSLDEFVPWLRNRPGNQSVGIAVREVLSMAQPSVQQVQAAVDLMEDDSRFIVTSGGVSVIDAVVRLADQEPEEIGPGDVTNDAQPEVAAADEEPKTIGEHLAEAQQPAAQAHPSNDPERDSSDSEVAVLEQRTSDADQAKSDKLQRIRHIDAAIKAEEQTESSAKRHLKEVKARLKELREDLREEIEGDPQARLAEMRAKEEAQVAATPIGQAIAGSAPMLADREFSARGMGMEAARLGKSELDCPFTRETNAKGLAQWFAGFREFHRADHVEREAKVQALFRDALQENVLPANGILPPGEECPKVATVEWDKRRALVLDMLAAGEGPDNLERWFVLALYTKDEWANLFAEKYGPPVAGVDANDEARAVRIKGGIDAGRVVKCGRSKLVVGPLEMLSVVTVKAEEAAA